MVNLSLHSIRIPHLRSNSQHNDPSRRKLQKLGQWTKYNQHIDASQNKKKTFFLDFEGMKWMKKSCIIISLQKINWQKKVPEVEKLEMHLGQGELENNYEQSCFYQDSQQAQPVLAARSDVSTPSSW